MRAGGRGTDVDAASLLGSQDEQRIRSVVITMMVKIVMVTQMRTVALVMTVAVSPLDESAYEVGR